MALPAGVGPIVIRLIDKASSRVTSPAEIDKKRWLRLVERYMGIFEPMADKAIKADGSRKYYHDSIEAYIRNSKNAAVENLNDLDKIKAELKRQNQLVQVRQESGAYVAKRLKDCSALELDTLAEQYERTSGADARRARFCRLLARQMRLAGLSDDAPLSQLLG